MSGTMTASNTMAQGRNGGSRTSTAACAIRSDSGSSSRRANSSFTPRRERRSYQAPLPDVILAGSDTVVLQTMRSHDQWNTTIYSDDDRYRGSVVCGPWS